MFGRTNQTLHAGKLLFINLIGIFVKIFLFSFYHKIIILSRGFGKKITKKRQEEKGEILVEKAKEEESGNEVIFAK